MEVPVVTKRKRMVYRFWNTEEGQKTRLDPQLKHEPVWDEDKKHPIYCALCSEPREKNGKRQLCGRKTYIKCETCDVYLCIKKHGREYSCWHIVHNHDIIDLSHKGLPPSKKENVVPTEQEKENGDETIEHERSLDDDGDDPVSDMESMSSLSVDNFFA